MAIDKNAVVKEAQKYIAKGQFDKAIAEWKKLLRESPSDPNLYNTIGDLCLKKDARMEAVDAYKKAADILAADGFTSKAIALYKKILNIDHQQIDVHIALGDLNAEKGLVGAALESYKLIADYYIHEKDMVKALGVYQKMADLNPSNIAFMVKLGDMYAKEGMNAEAARAYLSAADAHMAKEVFQEARLLFEKILAIDPNNKAVYHKAGLLYFKEGKFAEACKALKPAFENNPADQELSGMYLEALSRAGKSAEAQDALVKAIAQDQSRVDLREKLLNAYLENGELDRSLSEAGELARLKSESEGNPAAEAFLKSYVARVPDFAQARETLGEFYASGGNTDDASVELLRAAELYIAGGDNETGKAVLLRVLELVPGMPEAQTKLGQLEGALAPAEPAPFETPVVQPEPAPEPVITETFSPEPPPQPSAVPAEEAEDPAVAAALTEADVLLKYGMGAKAAEQLAELAAQFPKALRVRIKLRDLYRDLGDIDKAVQQALFLADQYQLAGNSDLADGELRSALEMAPNHSLLLSRLGLTPAEQPAPPQEFMEEQTEAGPPEILPDQLDIATTAPPVTGFDEAVQPLEPAPTFEETPQVLQPVSSFDQALEEDPIVFEELDGEPEAVEEITPLAEKQETPAMPEQPVEAVESVDISETWAEAEFYYQQGLFEEAKKHYTRLLELSPDNEKAAARLKEITREENETREFTKLADAVEGLEENISGSQDGALAASSSDEEAVNSLMKEISAISMETPLSSSPRRKVTPSPERRETPAKPTPKPAPPPSFAGERTATPPQGKKKREDFFDLGEELQKEVSAGRREQPKKSAEYFDLAAELRDELNAAPAPVRSNVAPEDQSLDDIFEDFKKGVEQQAVKEDTDTHYNLGVAYKEMGLLDDAIAEFILTPEGKPWFVESRYMLGLCYLEKGAFQNAINEIRSAFKHAAKHGASEEQKISMQFDLGLAYQGIGNVKAAINEFEKVADADPEYRDVSVKLKELQQGDFVSLAQLKDDIEKEISAKFFEEGERIERAEKSRRIDRSRD